MDGAKIRNLALHWLECEQQQHLIVDQERRIVWMNAAATAQLSRERELQNVGRVLVANDHSDQVKLAQFCDGCTDSLSSMAIDCADGDGHVLLRGRQIARIDGQRYIGLSVLRSGSEYRADYGDLQGIFKLTHREHQVLLKMADGKVPEELAAALGVTIETARSHIRQIYAKLGVNSREKLFRRIVPYRL